MSHARTLLVLVLVVGGCTTYNDAFDSWCFRSLDCGLSAVSPDPDAGHAFDFGQVPQCARVVLTGNLVVIGAGEEPAAYQLWVDDQSGTGAFSLLQGASDCTQPTGALRKGEKCQLRVSFDAIPSFPQSNEPLAHVVVDGGQNGFDLVGGVSPTDPGLSLPSSAKLTSDRATIAVTNTVARGGFADVTVTESEGLTVLQVGCDGGLHPSGSCELQVTASGGYAGDGGITVAPVGFKCTSAKAIFVPIAR